MSKWTLAYVDDDDDLRDIMALALGEESDMELVLCESGEKALEKLSMLQADLILLDVMMPGLDGPQTLHGLRQLPGYEKTPVVFITAKVQANDIAHYQDLGAAGTIMKPYDVMTLPAQVRNFLPRG